MAQTKKIIFPQPPRSGDLSAWRFWAEQLVRALQAMEQDRTTPISKNLYDVNNLSVNRTLDADGALAQGLDVLGTLIEDLHDSGVLKR